MTYRTVTTDDGVRLAVRESGPADAPIIVCVHGFPDDGTVWDGVAELLSASHRVVVYDVRGAGRSDRPQERSAYLLDRLAADLVTVVDDVSPDGPVHLLAHDWGSLQVWHALTRRRLTRVASYTSISGPSLHHAGRWMRAQFRSPRTWASGLRQAAGSSYLGFFQLPVLPEALSRSGLLNLLLRLDRSRRGLPVVHADVAYGLELYRANMMRGKRRRHRSASATDGRSSAASNELHASSGPEAARRDTTSGDAASRDTAGRGIASAAARSGQRQMRTVGVPVMVLAPTRDRYVTADLQTDISDWVPDLRIHRIRAGHWVPISHPELVARHVAEFVSTQIDR